MNTEQRDSAAENSTRRNGQITLLFFFPSHLIIKKKMGAANGEENSGEISLAETMTG